MSAAIVVTALFPHTGPRGAPRRVARGNRLSHLLAVGCALVPLLAMGQVFALGA